MMMKRTKPRICVAFEKGGKRDIALTMFGLAIHTAQDSTSPSHMGFQEFDPSVGNLSGPHFSMYVRDRMIHADYQTGGPTDISSMSRRMTCMRFRPQDRTSSTASSRL